LSAQIIDGKKLAAEVLSGAMEEAKGLPRPPGLAAVLIGENPASETYVRMKSKRCREIGFHSVVRHLPKDTPQEDALAEIDALNADEAIDGILVQLPLPEHLDTEAVQSRIELEKDVDGFHPANLGRLFAGTGPLFVPCTPLGCMHMIDSTGVDPKGLNAVVVGRGNLVGRPLSMLLLHRHATVTICHSRTRDLGGETRRADILVVATGKIDLVTADMIKPGAVVIDVGINRTPDGKIVGDVDFEGAKEVAGYISPVPGGVGPLTIAMVIKSTLQAAKKRLGAAG
jgi:methylenetetrahydrofolate dehydrogenase (NADP+)/methenyltetrahydrofolate cyclohydrolase